MTKLQTMSHRQARAAQVGLSYVFLLGFFALLYFQGTGALKFNVVGELKDVLMLMMSFWFMRQRESNPEALHPENPISPVLTPAQPQERKIP